jgi:hypothetical protein
MTRAPLICGFYDVPYYVRPGDGKKVTVFDGLSWKTSNIQHPMFQTPLGGGGLEVNVES